MLNEKILIENKERFVLFPIKHKEIWNLYKKIEHNFWTAETADLSQDVIDWKTKLSYKEKKILKRVLPLFAHRYNKGIDEIISRFISDVQYPEARCFYGYQLMQQNIHSEIYSWFAGTFMINDDLGNLSSGLNTNIALQKQQQWIEKNIINNNSFPESIISYIVLQRIFYSSSFSIINNFNLRKLLPNLSMISTFIYDDEGVFTDFSLSIYSLLKNKISSDRINEIIREAVEIEKEIMDDFILESMPTQINKSKINQYTEHIADRILEHLGCTHIYSSPNPFPFIKWQSFFVSIDPNYEWKDQNAEFTFSLDEDF